MEPVQSLKILAVEDDRDLAGLLTLLLENKLAARMTIAETCAAARQFLSSSSFDLVTLDFRLPDGNGLQLLEEIEMMENAPPVVMVTGKGDEATAVKAFSSGVSGYVMKDDRLAVMLPAVIERTLALSRAEKALQESEERYRTIFENTGTATLIVDDDTAILLANMESTRLYGYSKEELEGKHWTEFVHPEDLDRVMRFHRLRRNDPAAVPKGYEYRLINRSGEVRHVAVFAELLPGTKRSIASLLDLTATEMAEEKSEENFRALIENSADIIAVLGRDASIRYQSPSVKSQLGYEPEEVKGRSIFDFIHPDDVARAADALARALERPNETSNYIELRIRHKNGSWRYLAGTGQKMLSNPAVRGIILNARDVTEQLETEEALRASEEKYRTIFENAGAATLIIEKDSTIVLANREFEKLTGYTRDEVQGKMKVPDFTSPDDSERVMEFGRLRRLDPVSVPRHYEFRLVTKDGALREVAASVDMIPGTELSVASLLDITSRKEAEEAERWASAYSRSLIEASLDPFVMISPEGKITDMNEATVRVTGVKRSELLGTDFFFYFTEPEKARSAYQQVFTAGFVTDYPLTIRHRSGREIDVLYNATVYRDEQNRVLGVFAAARDITERLKAERALQESEALYRTLVNTSPEAITAANLEGKITFASDQTVKLHGFEEPQELLGRPAFDLFAPEERERAAANMQKTWASGKVESFAYKLLRKDGSVFDGELSTSAVIDAQGRPGGFIAVTRDITERKKAEEGMRRANAELEAFAGTVSHDLRGPLANVKMASKTVLDMLAGPLTDDTRAMARKVAETLQKSSERSINLVEELLKLAEAGQAPRNVADVDVRDIVERILDERAAAIKDKGMTVEIGADLGTVAADYTHVYQVFSNLISNAIRYDDNPAPVVEVSRLGDGDKSIHRYLVRDNGPGIPAESLDKIFVPFFKGKSGDAGIGLAIAEKIVKVYGGSIKAYNDHGACFEFVLRDFEG